MNSTKKTKVKLNILITLLCQIVTMICGVIVPKVLIDAYGSEAYGATASITQFLSYITLLEGGVGSIARAALYKPLADNDKNRIALIMNEIRRFFLFIACIFIVYVLLLACSYKYVSGIISFDWFSTFLLVVVISISTFVQYFIGISYAVLLQAAQKTYIVNSISLVTVFLNVVSVLCCVGLNMNMIEVKLFTSLVFSLKPLGMCLYVKNKFNIPKSKERAPEILQQKWTGFGQHIAFFLHYNTDTAVLTLLSDLTTVAVYSVYNMIVHQIQNLAFSFSAGMEAVFGNLLAQNRIQELNKWFEYYETLISVISAILYSTTASLIVPFVNLYTKNANDADYYQPIFAVLLVFASVVYCLRLPYHSMIIAAGHFKQTRIAAYGEALINIVLSIVLVGKAGLIGVAFATLIATSFRFVFYAFYLSRHICNRKMILFLKRAFVNMCVLIVVILVNRVILVNKSMCNYFQWGAYGVLFIIVSTVITILINWIFYSENITVMCKAFGKKVKKNNDYGDSE